MLRLRLYLLLIYSLLWAIIGISISYSGWTNTWSAIYVPALEPIFADMRTVQGSIMSSELGYNPQIYNPGDPWKRAMNYPKVWGTIAEIFNLDHEKNFIIFVCIYIIAYLYSCFSLLRNTPSVYYLLAMFSGASLLAIERGNNDLIIFIIMYFGIYLSKYFNYFNNQFRVILFISVTILKFFPVFSIFGFVKNFKVLFFISIATIFYFILNINEIRLIRSGNTANGYLAYGFEGIYLLASSTIAYNKIYINHVVLKGIILIAAALIIFFIHNKKIFHIMDTNDHTKDLFIIGSSIFCCTYIISMNWDYRLIFLLFCFPYVLLIRNKFIMHTTSIIILFSMNVLALSQLGKVAIYFNLISKFTLFIIMSSLLLQEIRNYLSSLSLPANHSTLKGQDAIMVK